VTSRKVEAEPRVGVDLLARDGVVGSGLRMFPERSEQARLTVEEHTADSIARRPSWVDLTAEPRRGPAHEQSGHVEVCGRASVSMPLPVRCSWTAAKKPMGT
jgi:hypothetical protein